MTTLALPPNCRLRHISWRGTLSSNVPPEKASLANREPLRASANLDWHTDPDTLRAILTGLRTL